MEKTAVRILRSLGLKPADDFVAGTPAGRIAMVWPITEELASLSPNTMLNDAYKEMLQ